MITYKQIVHCGLPFEPWESMYLFITIVAHQCAATFGLDRAETLTIDKSFSANK